MSPVDPPLPLPADVQDLVKALRAAHLSAATQVDKQRLATLQWLALEDDLLVAVLNDWKESGDSAALREQILRIKTRVDPIAQDAAVSDDNAKTYAAKIQTELEALQQKLPLAALPTAGRPSEFRFTDQHKHHLHMALVRLGYLTHTDDVPDPYDTKTGIANLSQLCFYRLAHNGTDVHLVVKFDRPDRTRKEWASIGDLWRLNCPPGTLLPINYQNPEDRILIFRVIENSVPLQQFLVEQLQTEKNYTDAILKETFDNLNWFYQRQPGEHDAFLGNKQLRWSDFFPHLADRADSLRKTAKKRWKQGGWKEPRIVLPSRAAGLVNPFLKLDELLKEHTGPIRLSRVHGDLNLSNVLVQRTAAYKLAGVVIIDLANSLPDQPTAYDFAFLESQFWIEVFPKLLAATMNAESILVAYVRCRDYLEGHDEHTNRPGEGIEAHCVAFVQQLRKHARDYLCANPPGAYNLADFFRCLALVMLDTLRFDSVAADPVKAKIALAGSSLAMEVAMNQRTRFYETHQLRC